MDLYFFKDHVLVKYCSSGEDVLVNTVIMQRNWGAILADLRSEAVVLPTGQLSFFLQDARGIFIRILKTSKSSESKAKQMSGKPSDKDGKRSNYVPPDPNENPDITNGDKESTGEKSKSDTSKDLSRDSD